MITLEKAIEMLRAYLQVTKFVPHQDIDDAIALGLHALERIKCTREVNITMNWQQLPGESNEQPKN